MDFIADDHFIYITGFIPFEVSKVLTGTKTKKGLRLPKNVHAMREVMRMIPSFKTNQKFVELGTALKVQQDYWLTQKNRVTLDDPRLREYQSRDAAYLKTRGKGLVLNEPRTGKTPTVITVVNNLGTKRNLIICPSSLVFNWEKELKEWYPGCEVFPVSGTPKKREIIYSGFIGSSKLKPSFLIISKDTWKLDIKKLGNTTFDTVVVDEAHFLRNYKTAQSKAVFSVKAEHRYALTGTPAVKHAVDVYGLLHFLDPKAFPSYWQFADRYFVVNDNYWGGMEVGEPRAMRENELRDMMEVNSVQRKRKDIMKWLPAAQFQTIPLQMEGKQLKLYEDMLNVFMAEDEESGTEIDAMNILAQLMRLRQLCLDPRLLNFDTPGVKTKALLEFAENNQEPFVVMSNFSSYFKIIKTELEKLGKKVGIIDGKVSKVQKHKTAEWFQNGKFDILLCNIISAGTGFTLDRADTILFLDRDFNPANNEQAQDRIVPTTEARYHPINIITLVCSGSVDERINEILENKEDLTRIINNPKELFRSA